MTELFGVFLNNLVGWNDGVFLRKRKNLFFCRPTQCVGAAFAMATWLSVCLSVTLMYCAQTIESTIMRPAPDCSPAILVFP